jgi:hypothetical protein
MSKPATFGFVMVAILVSSGSATFAQDCGANSRVGWVTRKPTGGLFYHCVCLPGYNPTAAGLVVTGHGVLHTPGCVRPHRVAAKSQSDKHKLLPVDPDNRFGNAPIHRKLQYVTHDSPHFDPGALSIDKNRKKKRGLKPIDLNQRIQ